MNREDIINQWIEIIESIEVDNLKRKIDKIKIYPSNDNIMLSAELGDLTNGVEEDIDYKSKRYSKWSFEFINTFIEILKFNGDTDSNSNWTIIKFIDTENEEYGYVEYRTFDITIQVKYDMYMKINRDRKINELGL